MGLEIRRPRVPSFRFTPLGRAKLTPAGIDGQLASSPLPAPEGTVSLSIGGVPDSSGEHPLCGHDAGSTVFFQVNVMIPPSFRRCRAGAVHRGQCSESAGPDRRDSIKLHRVGWERRQTTGRGAVVGRQKQKPARKPGRSCFYPDDFGSAYCFAPAKAPVLQDLQIPKPNHRSG